MTDGPLPGNGPLLVHLAEQLADARVLVLEQMAAQRALTDEAFKSQTTAHLDEQDDTLAELGRKLDAILASDAQEAEQRQKLLEQQRAATGHRDTVRRAAAR
jgi:hypothetical protein